RLITSVLSRLRPLCSSRVMEPQQVDIDGSVLEGGGQILRMAVSLSAIQKIPIRVKNIRAGRDKPGLRAQHLKGLEVARDISGGKLWGSSLHSTEIVFHPNDLLGGKFSADTETAGSVSLLIQVILPCALFAPSPVHLTLKGGTNADMAPQIDYTVTVFKKILEKFGGNFEGCIEKRGYFPRGGGLVTMRIDPVSQLKPVTLLDPGQVTRVWGRAFVAGNIPVQEGKKMADFCQGAIKSALGNIPVEIIGYKESPHQAVGNGSGVNLFAETSTGCILGGSSLGKRNLNVEEVSSQAVGELLDAIKVGACVDSHSQDQIIILMALAAGKSNIMCGPITLHTKTAIHIAEILTKAQFHIEECQDGRNIVSCEGIAMKAAAGLPMEY
ncbi:RNA 3'-terminal phosphate cyclase, partial [Frankliniella fusca]